MRSTQQKKMIQKSISSLNNSSNKNSQTRLKQKKDISPKNNKQQTQSEIENYQTTQKIASRHFVIEESPRPTSGGSNESDDMDEFDKKIDI